MANGKLTPKQERFVDEYLIDLNAAAAAKRAGYSEKTARSIGQENLTKPDIQTKIAERRKAREKRTNLTADDVVKDLQELARRGMREGDDYDPKTALRALELLGKHLGMFTDKTELTGANGAPLAFGPVEVEFVRAKNENAPS